MAKSGYILIADITGYTAYLTKTELDHARDTLQDLLNVVFDEIRDPLRVSKLEGDAVLAYAPDSAINSGQTLVEMVEVIYGAFRKALELMVLNTTCKCNACKVIGALDLKFFVHHGLYDEQRIGPFTELVGTDVNVVHRLTKNTVSETFGLTAYAMYSAAAIAKAGLTQIAESFEPHTETYEHIGEIQTVVQDLAEVWARWQSKMRLRVDPGEAMIERTWVIPVPQTPAWEYVTEPHSRAILSVSDTGEVDRIVGRIGEGSVYHCAHGDQHTELMVVDWLPFDEYSYKVDLPGGVHQLNTMTLTSVEGGTQIELRVGFSKGGTSEARALMDKTFSSTAPALLEQGIREFKAYVLSDQAA